MVNYIEKIIKLHSMEPKLELIPFLEDGICENIESKKIKIKKIERGVCIEFDSAIFYSINDLKCHIREFITRDEGRLQEIVDSAKQKEVIYMQIGA